MAKTHRVGMPLLLAGQSQKELSHNEALLLLDSTVNACCAGPPANDPPQDAEQGLTYICGTSPTGEWAGREGCLACWSASGWRFIDPYDGLQALDRTTGRTYKHLNGQWSLGIVEAGEVRVEGIKVVGVQQPAITNAAGGMTVDAEARATLEQVLEALRSHGLIERSG